MAQFLEEEQYHIQLNIKNKKFNFKLSARQSLPLFYHQNYYSNHFVWSNGFNKLQQHRLHAILLWKGYDLSFVASLTTTSTLIKTSIGGNTRLHCIDLLLCFLSHGNGVF